MSEDKFEKTLSKISKLSMSPEEKAAFIVSIDQGDLTAYNHSEGEERIFFDKIIVKEVLNRTKLLVKKGNPDDLPNSESPNSPIDRKAIEIYEAAKQKAKKKLDEAKEKNTELDRIKLLLSCLGLDDKDPKYVKILEAHNAILEARAMMIDDVDPISGANCALNHMRCLDNFNNLVRSLAPAPTPAPVTVLSEDDEKSQLPVEEVESPLKEVLRTIIENIEMKKSKRFYVPGDDGTKLRLLNGLEKYVKNVDAAWLNEPNNSSTIVALLTEICAMKRNRIMGVFEPHSVGELTKLLREKNIPLASTDGSSILSNIQSTLLLAGLIPDYIEKMKCAFGSCSVGPGSSSG